MNKIIDAYRANGITGVTASSEHPDFPAANLLDNHPKRLYKADGVSQSRLTFALSSGVEGLAIFNTNCSRAVCNISDPNAVTWRNVTWQNVEWITTDVPTTTYVISSGSAKVIWVEFAASSVAVHADVTLTNLDETPYAGCAQAGPLFKSGHDPLKQNFSMVPDDTSVEFEMSNGSYYTLDREVMDTYSGSMMLEHATAAELMAIAKDARKKPLAMMVTSHGADWALFARFSSMPELAPGDIELSVINFKLKEVL